jgi:hypothetical protein
MSNLGIPDRPVLATKEDVLGIKAYAQALSDFLLRCDTPITLGIQGDWGAGKTSLMNMVRELLQETVSQERFKCETVWFNTWMYSQFELGDQLPLLMLSSFVGSLKPAKNLAETSEGILKWAVRVGPNIIAKKLTGMSVKELADDEAGIRQDVNLLEELKGQFAKICGEIIAGDPRNRIVFFVDDLDRLRPDKAVELLEVMKNFLDVPGVVFVLACDYNVIAQGVEAKFGVTNRQSGGRSFFDKIIQVPFQMPVHTYDLEKYVGTLLDKLNWTISEQTDVAEVYKPLLEWSIGFNPRSIKRLFNSILLLKLVMNRGDDAQRAILADAHMMKLLFAIVCMEMAHSELHRYLASEVSQERLRSLRSDDSVGQLYQEDGPLEGQQPTSALPRFAALFYRLVDQNRDSDISDDELTALATAFNVSSVTSVNDPEPQTEPRPRRWDIDRFIDKSQEQWGGDDVEAHLRAFYEFFLGKKARIRFGSGKEYGSLTVHARLRGKGAYVQTLRVWTSGPMHIFMGVLNTSGAPGKRVAQAISEWCEENGTPLDPRHKEPSIDVGKRTDLLGSLTTLLDPLIL